jgi:PAS domain-containing protein
MVLILILVILSLLVVLLSSWRRNRKLLSEASRGSQDRDAGRTTAVEKANEDLKTAQAELQRRWQYLAEAQRLSHSGTFGWKVRSGKLVWSDETYTILGFTRETNPTLDLVFDRIHPEDRDRLQQLRDRAAQNGMDLDVEHRILLPDGAIRYVHAVAHAGRDSSGTRLDASAPHALRQVSMLLRAWLRPPARLSAQCTLTTMRSRLGLESAEASN